MVHNPRSPLTNARIQEASRRRIAVDWPQAEQNMIKDALLAEASTPDTAPKITTSFERSSPSLPYTVTIIADTSRATEFFMDIASKIDGKGVSIQEDVKEGKYTLLIKSASANALIESLNPFLATKIQGPVQDRTVP